MEASAAKCFLYLHGLQYDWVPLWQFCANSKPIWELIIFCLRLHVKMLFLSLRKTCPLFFRIFPTFGWSTRSRTRRRKRMMRWRRTSTGEERNKQWINGTIFCWINKDYQRKKLKVNPFALHTICTNIYVPWKKCLMIDSTVKASSTIYQWQRKN